MRNFYDELPRFLQDYVRNHGWTGFRDVQNKSFEILFDTDNHLLITSGTSSGKTEAALFPVITSLYKEPCKSIGALYISPLKALIDDQFERVDGLLACTDINVTSWHGDISQSIKRSLMRDPSGILQTTPESLQSMLFNRRSDILRMFSDLRFIIIDEVHAFMNSTRGLQLMCELESISRITGCRPRRIGLSATLTEVDVASEWLRGNDDRRISVVECGGITQPDISMTVDFFPKTCPLRDDDPISKEMNELRKARIKEYYSKLFDQTDRYNCLIFANSRLEAEKITRNLKIFSRNNGSNKSIEIHHGSISKEIRKDSEDKIRNSQYGATVVTTSTLELGIDIGNIERVIQKDPPYSCSSLIQRIGRSGRRTGVPVLRMFCSCDMDKDRDYPFEIPINLIRGIAMIELCIRDRWVEPIRHSSLPYGLLFQQTMGYIGSNGGASFGELCNDVLSCHPFRNITESDYKVLLKHLAEQEYIGYFERSLVLMEKGEKIVGSIDFLATFSDDNRFEVMSGDKLVGFIPKRPTVNSHILLAGRTWSVKSVSGNSVEVDNVVADAVTNWDGGDPFTHERILQKMKEVLDSDDSYPYLDKVSSDALDTARAVSKRAHLTDAIPTIASEVVDIHPWIGSAQYNTLVRLLKHIKGITVVDCIPPYNIRIRTKYHPESIRDIIEEYRKKIDPYELITKNDYLEYEKFDRYIPKQLLKKKFVNDKIDLEFSL